MHSLLLYEYKRTLNWTKKNIENDNIKKIL